MKHNDNNDPLSTSADDPRLTAYALGEMDASERAAFEAEIRDNPAAQAAIADIRTLSSELQAALSAEPLPESAAGNAEILLGGRREAPPQTPSGNSTLPAEPDWRAAREAEARAARKRARPNKPFRFPYFLIAGFATACFAIVFFTIVKPDYDSHVQKEQARVKAAEEKTYVALPIESPMSPTVALETPAIVSPPPSAQPLPAAKTVIYTDQYGDLTQGSVNEFMKYMPGIAPNADDGTTVRIGGMDPRHRNFSLNGMRASSIPDSPNTESYTAHTDNTFQRVAENPLSTFSADIDTASYTNVRRFLNRGQRPPRDAVRIEEMINYFSYDYAPPAKDSAAPFAATMEVAAAPWNPEHRLVRIGIKGRELDAATRPPANLVFLLDVSGSMDEPNKLPLVKESMRMLVNRLRPDDRIAIVTYANTIDLALASTPVGEKSKILDALDALRASGGTNGGKGIQLAYEIAKANFINDGANRVILCTDGDFNIGITNRDELTALIEEKAKSGVFLTVLGFGMGNLKDSTLQLLAGKGNGNHGYIDNRDEARRLLVEQTAGTLVTIAKDVKLQVEFNPAQAESYRLIGYEKRLLAKEDFNNDKVDAGEIGAGHTVTALYEVTPAKPAGTSAPGNAEPRPGATATVDPLKYQAQTVVTTTPKVELKGELLTLKIRYKSPSSDMSDKVEFVLEDKGADFAEASPDFKFTCSIAAFGMILRDSAGKGLATYDRVLEWAGAGMGGATDAESNRRSEFTDLVRRARQIATN